MTCDPQQPYNDLPALPPQAEVESRAVLKACIAARAAVAEPKAAGQLIPNQGVLINSSPLLKAQDSSEIENIVTTTDQMFLFDAPAKPRPIPPPRKRCATALRCGRASRHWPAGP
ncbi:Fic/DOC family N-terminal domain-containing protein [Roseateles sp. DC23W]|uniref:Fic/DOC family N-terminal domain-containing protein n=1 Tax=Pelomonas dachongensis TaxID=3299029 RepID=A0ABW7EM03_9BURK